MVIYLWQSKIQGGKIGRIKRSEMLSTKNVEMKKRGEEGEEV